MSDYNLNLKMSASLGLRYGGASRGDDVNVFSKKLIDVL